MLSHAQEISTKFLLEKGGTAKAVGTSIPDSVLAEVKSSLSSNHANPSLFDGVSEEIARTLRPHFNSCVDKFKFKSKPSRRASIKKLNPSSIVRPKDKEKDKDKKKEDDTKQEKRN